MSRRSLRVTSNVLLAAVLVTTLAACGKKTAPVPPADVLPGQQERTQE